MRKSAAGPAASQRRHRRYRQRRHAENTAPESLRITAIITDVVRNYVQDLPRLRPGRARRRVRPGGVRAEPRPDPRAPRARERAGAPLARPAATLLVRREAH